MKNPSLNSTLGSRRSASTAVDSAGGAVCAATMTDLLGFDERRVCGEVKWREREEEEEEEVMAEGGGERRFETCGHFCRGER